MIYQCTLNTILTKHAIYLKLLNLSLSVSNMCLRLRFSAWAVYQSWSFWKLGSCVSPMLFRVGLLCSAVLYYPGWVGLNRSVENLFEGLSRSTPPTSDTLYSGLVFVTHPRSPAYTILTTFAFEFTEIKVLILKKRKQKNSKVINDK